MVCEDVMEPSQILNQTVQNRTAVLAEADIGARKRRRLSEGGSRNYARGMEWQGKPIHDGSACVNQPITSASQEPGTRSPPTVMTTQPAPETTPEGWSDKPAAFRSSQFILSAKLSDRGGFFIMRDRVSLSLNIPLTMKKWTGLFSQPKILEQNSATNFPEQIHWNGSDWTALEVHVWSHGRMVYFWI